MGGTTTKSDAQVRRTVKAIWEVMEREGICDEFGGGEYLRCKPIVFEFVKAIIQQCNTLTPRA